MSIQTGVPPRRSSRKILIPALLVLAIAVAWSGFWAFARAKAEQLIDEALAREASKGRVLTCAERRLGGYPFRIEVRCRDPRLAVTRERGSFTATAANLVAVAQIYRPNHVILEAEGPLAIVPADGGSTLDASFATAEASVIVGFDGSPQRASLVATGLTLAEVTADDRRVLASGVGIEGHARVAQGASAAPGTYDVAIKADATAVPLADAVLGGAAPSRAEFQGVITGLGDLELGSWEERLRDWAQAGGILQVALARLDRGKTSATATGQVALDVDGRPTGKLVLTLAGIDDLSKGLQRSGAAAARLATLLGVGLNMLGKPASIDGRPAVEIPLTLADGQANVGAFPAGETPRFF